MNSNQIINIIRGDVLAVKALGKETIRIEALEKYLDQLDRSMEMDADRTKSEHRAALVQLAIAQYGATTQHTLAQSDAVAKQNNEMLKAVVDSGKEALNSLVLVNGGAVVALLGFMGAMIAKGLPSTLGLRLAHAIVYFGSGVLTGAVGFGTRYMSQHLYAGEHEKSGFAFTIVAMMLGVAGYSFFAVGFYNACSALAVQFSP